MELLVAIKNVSQLKRQNRIIKTIRSVEGALLCIPAILFSSEFGRTIFFIVHIPCNSVIDFHHFLKAELDYIL